MRETTKPPVKAWECTGCGRIEAPRPCLGICSDRAVELVHPDTYRDLQQRQARLERDHAQMRELVLRLARTTPRNGRWEAGYRALQRRAADLLDRLERHDAQGLMPE